MKMVMIAYNEAVDAEVMELLQHNGVEGFSKWTKTHGRGVSSGPHLLSHVWSKGNNVLMTCVDDDKAVALVAGVRALRGTLGKAGIKAFALPVSDIT